MLMSHLGDPSLQAFDITKANSDIPKFRYLYVGGTGDVRIKNVDGTFANFTAVPAGQYIYASGIGVWSTGTSATGIVGIR